MKKILSLVCLLMLAMTSAWADEATFDLSKSPGTSTPEGFFTHEAASAAGKWNWNGKFKNAEYDGITFSQGLKMEGATAIDFTTEAVSKVTIVQSTNSANTIKFDGTELAVADAAAGTGCRIYTVENVAAGKHTIARGSGESGLFYVKVEWTSTKTVTFQNTAGWDKVYVWAWNDTENFTGGAWPGQELTPNGDGTFTWSTLGNPTMIIFNNGGSDKTADLEFKDGGVYNINGRVITLNDYSATFTTDGMTEVWAYAWNGDDKPLGEWPGTQMTASGEGQFSIAIKAEEAPKYIIFHNNAGQQTDDLDFENGKAYVYNLNDYTATFTTDAAWDKVYAYAWSGDTKFFGDFPGQELTATEGVYTLAFKAFKAPESILFNSGTDAGKTPDMGFTSGRKYVWNTTLNPLFKLEASDATIHAGTTVEVKDKEDKVVATLTYGVEGGADFAAPVVRDNEEVAGFTAYTAGNGENGSATGGTVYTIKPVYDGTITVGVWLNAGKPFFIQEGDNALEGFNGIKKDYGSSTSFTFDVKANSVYKVYCTGSKLGFYGFDYTYAAPAQPETKTYYVVGNDETVFGEAWNPGFEGNKMTANQDGSYTWTSAEVNFSKNEGVQFKITDGTWDENYGLNGEANGDNILAKPTVDGANTLTITFNPTTDPKTISYEFAKEATLNTYTAKFENNGNWAEVYAYTYSKDEGGNVTAQELGTWPGKKIEPQEGNYVVDIQAAAAPQYIIFNNGVEGEGAVQTEDLVFEDGKTYKYEAPAPIGENDIVISPAEGDIAAALAAAKEGKETVGNITINLKEGASYTIGSSLVVPNSLTINGNGAKIDASAVSDALIQYSALAVPSATRRAPETPVEGYTYIDEISIKNITITGIKGSIYWDGNTKVCIENFAIENAVLGLASESASLKDNTLVSFQGGCAKDFTIKNSTIYGNAVAKYFNKANNAADFVKAGYNEAKLTYENNTFYNLLNSDGQWGNNLRYNNNKAKVFAAINNNIWVDCGNGQIMRRLLNTNFKDLMSGSTMANNLFQSNGAVVDQANYGNASDINGIIAFTDAANGDFSGVMTVTDGSVMLQKIGDLRWFVMYNYPDEPLANPEKLYIIGDITPNGWAKTGLAEMNFDETTQTFTYEFETTLSRACFAIADVAEFTDWADFNFYHRYAYEQQGGDQKAKFNEATQLTKTKGEGTIELSAGKYTISISKADGKMTITEEVPEPVVISSMAIVGELTGGWPDGEDWSMAKAMTQDAENSAIWTLTVNDVEVEAKTYYYKATANGKWGDYELPSQGNNEFTFGTEECPAGKYNLTFVANTEQNTLTLTAERVSNPDGISSVKTVDLNDAPVFNLNGQRVNKAQKGLFIVGGKKVVIK